jgi:hypothetical protein
MLCQPVGPAGRSVGGQSGPPPPPTLLPAPTAPRLSPSVDDSHLNSHFLQNRRAPGMCCVCTVAVLPCLSVGARLVSALHSFGAQSQH